MSAPMRKEEFEGENLTTADLAQGVRSDSIARPFKRCDEC